MTDSEHDQFYTPPYDFIDNGAAELMLIYEAVPENPDSPFFYFDGEKAVLKRKTGQSVVFPFIESAVKKLLDGGKKIMITEMNGEEIVRVYEAAVRFVGPDELPATGKKENIGKKYD